jgi:hypothetical protein
MRHQLLQAVAVFRIRFQFRFRILMLPIYQRLFQKKVQYQYRKYNKITIYYRVPMLKLTQHCFNRRKKCRTTHSQHLWKSNLTKWSDYLSWRMNEHSHRYITAERGHPQVCAGNGSTLRIRRRGWWLGRAEGCTAGQYRQLNHPRHRQPSNQQS